MRVAGYRTAMVGKVAFAEHARQAACWCPIPRDPALAKPNRRRSPRPPRRTPAATTRNSRRAWRRDPGRTYGVALLRFEQGRSGDRAWRSGRRPLQRVAGGAPCRSRCAARAGNMRCPRPTSPRRWPGARAFPRRSNPTSYVAETTIARLTTSPRRPTGRSCSNARSRTRIIPSPPPGRYWVMYRAADVALPESWTFDRALAPPASQASASTSATRQAGGSRPRPAFVRLHRARGARDD